MKPLHFIGSSRDDLSSFPDSVKREAGFALYLAQMGDKSVNAVPMVGFGGAKVLEVTMHGDGDAFRAVYTVKFAKATYMLHAFQKKSKKGDTTPKPDMSLIRTRLQAAERHYEEHYGQSQKRESKHERRS
jgi:phage-related protein